MITTHRPLFVLALLGSLSGAAMAQSDRIDRAQLRAATAAAVATGQIPRGEAPVREATANELERIRLAGERARAAVHNVAAR